jgi:adenylate cyclase
MTDKSIRFRFDFIQKVASIDEKSGIISFRLEPDPRRYEWKVIKGKRTLYDKFDDIYFTEECVLDGFRQLLQGKPIYFERPDIESAEEYIKSRKSHITAMLEGGINEPTFKDKSEEFLESLKQDKLAFVIVSLDIVGSTKLATEMDPKLYARIIATILYELSEIIPKFRGYVLKYTGDGLIAYFPEPSFIRKNDLAIDCALTLRGLVYNGLNPVLREKGYPALDIRIGLDSGEAYVEIIGSPETKQHKDIIGKVVSLAAKIQTQAKPGDIYLGDTTERNLHISWRQICELADLKVDWGYKDSEGNPYKIHRVRVR